jgi:hypothetical protein
VELDTSADGRRSISEIVADLARTSDPPQKVTQLKPHVESGEIAAPAVDSPVSKGPHSELAQMLADAQARAVSQRVAAERLLQEAQELEARLADEAARAQEANTQAIARELAATLERARADERAAAEEEAARSRDLDTFVARRKQVQTRQAELLTAHRIASGAFAEAKRRLEDAEAACRESDRLLSDAGAAEQTARAEAESATQRRLTRRKEREEIEQQLSEIDVRATESPVSLPSLETVEQLRAGERALRIAQRRAADAQRNFTG